VLRLAALRSAVPVITWDSLGMAQVAGGRRWRRVMWLNMATDDRGLDRIESAPWHPDLSLLSYSRDYEYRMVFDPDHGLWALDMRRHVQGG